MEKKPFSTLLYNTNDDAKYQVIDWLLNGQWEAEVNPDQYGIDVLAVDEFGDDYKFEVEVKHNWKGSSFPFKEVHWPARKLKFAKEAGNVMFIMLNHERTHALVADGRTVLDSLIVAKPTKYTAMEEFIEVPISRCRIFSFEDDLPTRIL